jgi:hypothetical protein
MRKPKRDPVIKLEGEVTWQYGWEHTTGHWFAICDPLKITLQADSLANLQTDMNEAVDALLQELLSTGALKAFLNEQGWRSLSPIPNSARKVVFDVPTQTRRLIEHDLATEVC